MNNSLQLNAATKQTDDDGPDLLSIGSLCATLGVLPDVLKEATQLAGIKPAMRLDRIRYYDANRFDEIRRAVEAL